MMFSSCFSRGPFWFLSNAVWLLSMFFRVFSDRGSARSYRGSLPLPATSTQEMVESQTHRAGKHLRQPAHSPPSIVGADVMLHGLFTCHSETTPNSVRVSRFCGSSNRMQPGSWQVSSGNDVRVTSTLRSCPGVLADVRWRELLPEAFPPSCSGGLYHWHASRATSLSSHSPFLASKLVPPTQRI